MKNSRPFMVTFIGDITFLIGLLAFVSGIFGAIKAFQSMTEPNTIYMNTGIVIVLEIISLAIPVVLMAASIGYLKLKSWGYWILVLSNVLILLIAIIVMLQNSLNISYLIILQPVISLVFIIPTRKYFNEMPNSEVENV